MGYAPHGLCVTLEDVAVAPVMAVCSRRYLAKFMFARRVCGNATRFVAFGLALRQRCNPLAPLRGHIYFYTAYQQRPP